MKFKQEPRDEGRAAQEGLENKLRFLMQTAAEWQQPEAQRRAAKLLLRVAQGPVRMLVMGDSSAGKSTLINALLGTVVMPEAGTVSSAVPVWISARTEGEEVQVDIYNRDSEGMPLLSEPEIVTRNAFLENFCYSVDVTGDDNRSEKFQNRFGAFVRMRSELLESGVAIVDTLGLSASKGDSERTLELLQDMPEIVLFVTRHEGNALLQTEREAIAALLERGIAPERLLLVHNSRTNLLSGEFEHPQEVSEGMRIVARQIFKDRKVPDLERQLFCVNAHAARLKRAGRYCWAEHLPPSSVMPEQRVQAEKNDREERAIWDGVHGRFKGKDYDYAPLTNLSNAIAECARGYREGEGARQREEWESQAEEIARDMLRERQRQLAEAGVGEDPQVKDAAAELDSAKKLLADLEASGLKGGWENRLDAVAGALAKKFDKLFNQRTSAADQLMTAELQAETMRALAWNGWDKNALAVASRDEEISNALLKQMGKCCRDCLAEVAKRLPEKFAPDWKDFARDWDALLGQIQAFERALPANGADTGGGDDPRCAPEEICEEVWRIEPVDARLVNEFLRIRWRSQRRSFVVPDVAVNVPGWGFPVFVGPIIQRAEVAFAKLRLAKIEANIFNLMMRPCVLELAGLSGDANREREREAFLQQLKAAMRAALGEGERIDALFAAANEWANSAQIKLDETTERRIQERTEEDRRRLRERGFRADAAAEEECGR